MSITHISLVLWQVSQLLHAHHKKNYTLLVENACLSVCLHSNCHSTLWLSSYPDLRLNVTLLKFNFLSQNIRHLFSVKPNSPTAVYCIIKQHCRRKTCPCIVCIPLFKLCRKTGCNCMTSCHDRTCLSFPTQTYIICISLTITKFINFDPKTFVFL